MSALGRCALAAALLVSSAAACSEDTPATDRDDAAVPGVDAAATPGTDASSPEAAAPPVDAAVPPDLANPTVACEVSPCVVELVRGDEHFCARTSDGDVYCWGGDPFSVGVLGIDTEADARPSVVEGAPAKVPGLGKVVQLSAEANVTCARTSSSVLCWGDNSRRQLALSGVEPAVVDVDPHPVPTAPAIVGVVQRIDVGFGSVCARIDGSTWCWGDATDGKLLRPAPVDGTNVLAPGLAGLPATVQGAAEVRIGNDVGLARTEEGAVFSWGRFDPNSGGLLGRISSLPIDLVPEPLALGGAAIHLSTDGFQACAVLVENMGGGVGSGLWCWGSNQAGQLGIGVQADQKLPTRVKILAGATERAPQSVSSGYRSTCVRSSDGAVYCAGDNSKGRLAQAASTAIESIFVFVPGVVDAASVVVGRQATCALRMTGAVVCWGSNDLGQLGLGSRDDLAHPTPSSVVFP